MEVDILKPDTGVVTIERPLHSSSKGTSSRAGTSGQTTPERVQYTEPVSEGEDDEEMDLAPGKFVDRAELQRTHMRTAKDEDKRTGLSGQDFAAAVAIREKNLKERSQDTQRPKPVADDADVESDGEETTPFLKRGRDTERNTHVTSTIASALENTAQVRAMSIDPLAPSSAFDETLRDRLREDAERRNGEEAVEDEDDDEGDEENGRPRAASRGEGSSRGDERLLERHWTAPTGKRIAVPVRIEPKVYFAAERTFFVSALVSPPPPLRTTDNQHAEMAALWHLHRHDRDDAAQLHPAGGHDRADQRVVLHRGCARRHCVLCDHLRLPLVALAQSPGGRDVLRQVWADGAVDVLVRGPRDQYCAADTRDVSCAGEIWRLV